MRDVVFLGMLAVGTASSASATDLEMMEVINDLSTVIASEDFCGLTYDQAAIAAFVEAKVPADDMGFASSLNIQVTGSRYMNDKMTASAKTAHCTQITRVAKSYGFTK